MATVKKRTWTTTTGEKKTAWQLSYVDANGNRHREQFPSRRAADTRRIRVEGDISGGTYIDEKTSKTVLQAANAYLDDFSQLVTTGKREFSTYETYDQHVRLHISVFEIAKIKLAKLSGPDCVNFATDLEANRSDAMAKKVFKTLQNIISFSIRKGWIKANPATGIKIRTAGARVAASGDNSRDYFPSPTEIKSLLKSAKARRKDDRGRAYAMVVVLLTAGLRASEMRALRRRDVDLKNSTIRVAQRADRKNNIGAVKTEHSAREIPIPSETVRILREWMIAAPKSHLDLVFPTSVGTVQSYKNIYDRIWVPMMTAAKLVNGQKPRFGLHALRHAACSNWIAVKASKLQVKEWAGHHSVEFTIDVYGHLWPEDKKPVDLIEQAGRFILQ